MWIDRLTQTQRKELPSSIEVGRFQWSINANDNERINQHSEIEPGQLLVSDESEHWHLSNSSGSFHKPGINNPERINLFKKAILTLGETLLQTEKIVPKTGEEQLLSPLLPATVIDAELSLLPVELTLKSVLEAGHLHSISQQPRLDIRYIEETTDIARAKRLAKGALVHLASHSECWQRQTLNGIVPKKVKARFSEDDFQIYENRVFARLIDKLNQHLNSRIRTVEQLQQTLDEALGFEHNANAIDYRVSQKICALWGRTFDSDATLKAKELLENTLESLKTMLKSIITLRQTGLYLMVPRFAQIGSSLHRTNILNHDPHYRHLAILWDQLNSLQQTTQLTPAQRFEQEQRLAKHYSHYAGLMLRHALEGNTQIRLIESKKHNSNNEFDTSTIDYKWADQTLRLQQIGYDWALKLVPAASKYTVDKKELIILEFCPLLSFSSISHITDTLPKNRIILWPSIEKISNQKAEAQAGWYALSPLDLYCVERLGWLIDQSLNQQLIQQYSEPIEKIPNKTVDLIRTIQTKNKFALELKGNPTQLRVLTYLSRNDANAILESLQNGNANDQAHKFYQQQIHIEALEHCPVCGVHTPLIHQPPNGFKIECQSDCGCNRYLKNNDDNLEIHFKERDQNKPIGYCFSVRGRWTKMNN